MSSRRLRRPSPNHRDSLGARSEELGHAEPSDPRHQKPRCKICKEAFDLPWLTVRVTKGRAHPLCAALKAVGMEKLATSSGRW
jgi:hypothetical protein